MLATDPQVGLEVGYAVAQECTQGTAVREYKRLAQTGRTEGAAGVSPWMYRLILPWKHSVEAHGSNTAPAS